MYVLFIWAASVWHCLGPKEYSAEEKGQKSCLLGAYCCYDDQELPSAEIYALFYVYLFFIKLFILYWSMAN